MQITSYSNANLYETLYPPPALATNGVLPHKGTYSRNDRSFFFRHFSTLGFVFSSHENNTKIREAGDSDTE